MTMGKLNLPLFMARRIYKDKGDKEYEVKLSTRWELKFDFKGNLIDLEND